MGVFKIHIERNHFMINSLCSQAISRSGFLVYVLPLTFYQTIQLIGFRFAGSGGSIPNINISY
jgi:hypothetical protein